LLLNIIHSHNNNIYFRIVINQNYFHDLKSYDKNIFRIIDDVSMKYLSNITIVKKDETSKFNSKSYLGSSKREINILNNYISKIEKP
jgi:hypothetical protein